MGLLSYLGQVLTLRTRGFWTAFGAGPTWAGKAVTPDSVMQIAAAMACVRLIATTASTLPLRVYRRRPDGSREQLHEHPLAVVLQQSPNLDQTPAEFLEGMVACAILWGNAYAAKTRSVGQVRALTILRPDLMFVRRDPETLELRYEYAHPRGREVFKPDEVWHLKAFGFGGDLGLSAIEFGRQAFGLAMATDEAAARTFSNGMRPAGFFVTPNSLTPEQRVQARQSLIDPMTGAENAGRVGILESGAFTWQSVAMPARDAELLATRGLHIAEICRIVGNVPPVLIGHAGEGVTAWGSGIESLIQHWLTTGLGPLLFRIEQSANRALVAAPERGRVWCEFAVEGLLRANSEQRAKLYASAAQNAWMTRNEIRRLENLPEVEGGDVLTAQSNLLPLDRLGTIVTPTREEVIPPDHQQEQRQ